MISVKDTGNFKYYTNVFLLGKPFSSCKGEPRDLSLPHLYTVISDLWMIAVPLIGLDKDQGREYVDNAAQCLAHSKYSVNGYNDWFWNRYARY